MRDHAYTIRTDGVLDTVSAPTIDEAAAIFARHEFPRRDIRNLADLFLAVEAVEGAWIWIESLSAPDGARQSAGMLP